LLVNCILNERISVPKLGILIKVNYISESALYFKVNIFIIVSTNSH